MDALEPDAIVGNWAPLLIPFDARGRVALARLEEEIEALIAFDVDGIATGPEVEQLSDDEAEQVHTVLARLCAAADVPFQIAVYAPDVEGGLRRMQRAERHEPGALRVRLPERRAFDGRRGLRDLERFAAACSAIGLVWELSGAQQLALECADLTRILDALPTLLGIGLAQSDEELLEGLRPYQDELSIFVPGEALATGWRHGACGSVSLLSCLHPGHAQGYFQALEHQIEDALAFERRVQRFLENHVARVASSRAARGKLLCAIGGWCDVGLATRPAQRTPVDQDVPRLTALAREALPEFFTRTEPA